MNYMVWVVTWFGCQWSLELVYNMLRLQDTHPYAELSDQITKALFTRQFKMWN